MFLSLDWKWILDEICDFFQVLCLFDDDGEFWDNISCLRNLEYRIFLVFDIDILIACVWISYFIIWSIKLMAGIFIEH